MIFEPICALATPFGIGAISVIRVSGETCFELLDKITTTKTKLEQCKANSLFYTKISASDGFIIDEVIISVFKAPYSFTGENVCEISTHGGIFVTNKVIERLLEVGFKMAEKGEFSRRAFLNKKIDLVKAESINDMIFAKSDSARIIASYGLTGQQQKPFYLIKEELELLINNILVNIDYPEYEDLPEVNVQEYLKIIKKIQELIKKILGTSEDIEALKNGINTLILGKPNTGKSSLLNLLLGKQKAIVSSISGTTRDLIEESVLLDGIMLNLVDSAGITNTSDEIEQIGIKLAFKQLKKAAVVLYLVDISVGLDKTDLKNIKKILAKNIPLIIIYNKKDLVEEFEIDRSLVNANIKQLTFQTNVKTYVKKLTNSIKEAVNLQTLEQLNLKNDIFLTTSARQTALLKESMLLLKKTVLDINNNLFEDVYVLNLKLCHKKICDILGLNFDDELINDLFSRFCIGK